MTNAKTILKGFRFENYEVVSVISELSTYGINHSRKNTLLYNSRYGQTGRWVMNFGPTVRATKVIFDDKLSILIKPVERSGDVIFFEMEWNYGKHDTIAPIITATKVKDIIPTIKKSETYQKTIGLKKKLKEFIKE